MTVAVETPLAAADWRAIGDTLERSAPQDILRWAAERFGGGLTMATAFGAEGCVLLAMLAEVAPDVDVFNLDTGYQYPETLELRERIRARYGIAVRFVRAEETVEAMERRFGGPIYRSDPDACCRIRKVEPLKGALVGRTAWISAIRRNQTHHRRTASIVEWDAKFGLVKVSPLANWTKQGVWDYIRRHDVPYNPLHDQGYPSISCWPCTRPVEPGQDERAGRWSGFAKTECGLHTR